MSYHAKITNLKIQNVLEFRIFSAKGGSALGGEFVCDLLFMICYLWITPALFSEA